MERVVVIGGGGHAKVLISIVKKLNREVIGYTDLADRGEILSVPYLGPDDTLAELARIHPGTQAAMGLGKIDASPVRGQVFARAKARGFSFPAFVSPGAILNEEVDLGEGTVLFDGAVVNTATVIDELCIVNTNATVEHDCRLGRNVHVAPGAVVSGRVTIGDDCMIGAGSVVVQSVFICPGCLVGAGAVVTHDIREPGVYAGAPARRIR
jgi:sugar O-acyltransferase (sialic acid O-acetyltransferase NeuD family)